MNDEPEYVSEINRNSDGTSEKLLKNREGRIISRSIFNCNDDEVERFHYDAEGNISGRAVYEVDGHRKPLKTTAYDSKGNVIFVKERGKSPVFYGDYRSGAPPFMRSKD
jgi:hypothetical protein